MQEYFATTPDPERGWALAALTGELSFAEAKPSQVRDLATPRVDPALFAWLDGRAERPQIGELPTFCPIMLAQPLEEDDVDGLDPRDFLAEWKWDGIRVQLVARGGEKRLYSRSGDDIGAAFPDILDA